MHPISSFPLKNLESKLRWILPADLYAAAWVKPGVESLTGVFEHLRALHRVLADYVPPDVSDQSFDPYCQPCCQVVENTLMFTDLAGFTSLMEANATRGKTGATELLNILNHYFATALEIISLSGGELLEFTGDAMLIRFSSQQNTPRSTAQAVRAGLRLQRAMEQFCCLETTEGTYSLGMRIGIHTGRYLTANIGTPMRMDYVLLGENVRQTKKAEGAGTVGRVCLTETAYQQVKEHFHFEPTTEAHHLVVDDFSEDQLGQYEIMLPRRHRSSHLVLMDRSMDGLVAAIAQAVEMIEPLCSYLPRHVLDLVVENVARRGIPADFADPTVLFVNLIGLSESAHPELSPEENEAIATLYCHAFALINAAVESRGGMLKKVTYHLSSSDTMILFGVPVAHANNAYRAAKAALAIREIIQELPLLNIGGQQIKVACKIGMAQ
ncbi:MAG: adenylate/guanylate cyclase domain-containing protein, partial [Chloroflexi bacterium]|nr:adenylate/guanylate cyclase domain-containing protein [Chloroflexota bacterium]